MLDWDIPFDNIDHGTGQVARLSDARVARKTYYCESVLMPNLPPGSCTLLHSQAGPYAGAWLAAVPSEPATTFAFIVPAVPKVRASKLSAMQLVLCRRFCGSPLPYEETRAAAAMGL